MIKKIDKNIAITINSKYVKYALTMLYSFFQNNKYSVNIYLFYSLLTTDEIERLKKLVTSNNSNFYTIKINEKDLPNFVTMDYFSIEASYRLLIPYLIPDNIDRILYLDSDMIIRKDISELFTINIGKNPIACCLDVSHIGSQNNVNIKRLDIRKTKKYYNSGLIIYDVKKYKKIIDIKDYNVIIKKINKKIKYPDQDILNYIFQNKIYELNSEYNVFFTSNYKYENKQQVQIIKESGKIFHYISCNKADNYKYLNFGFNEYWKYAKKVYGLLYFIKIYLKNYVYRITNLIPINNISLKKGKFSIICNNCVGGIIYNRLKMRFDSPFINLWIGENDYLNIIKYLKLYLNKRIEPLCLGVDNNGNEYPICKLGNINLNCVHYSSFDEAINAWNRRKKRLNYRKSVYLFVTNSKNNVYKFLNLPFDNKICICPFKFNDKHVMTIYPDILDDSWYNYVLNYYKNEISVNEIIQMFESKCNTIINNE